ncbi:hypothetical protein AZI86_13280 [Bdellovibrio bacteriovorus]|uniref:Response regulatory domain-containing protein n=1 Tax=Bdellovibrio bacteriovorus TaxID=959 RepID=A0A150WJB6_BDEBC|nr:response regulator [Bdellovibrio bacteriovorus]KYG63790.1 hypothetical protein AZI86_13280 [Bdellovibrio bacteriovorus]
MMQELNLNCFANPKVLVVDDCLDSVRLISTVFNHYHCDADIAFDGKDALTLMRTRKYDLIVLDWNMPNLGGYDTLSAMEDMWSSEPRPKRMPVLIYTSANYSDLIVPELKHFKYVGFIDKSKSLATKIKTVGQTLSLI